MFKGPPEKREPGILEAVLGSMPDPGNRPTKQKPFKVVTEFQKDPSGQTIEIRRELAENDELLSESTFQNGIKKGEHKKFENGKLRESAFYYDQKGRRGIRITYNEKGMVVSAYCSSGLFFTDEHKKVCGFDKPFSYVTKSLGGRQEVTLEKGKEVLKKLYRPDGTLWIEDKFQDDRSSHNVYSEKGILVNEIVSYGGRSEQKNFNEKGVIKEKWMHSGRKETYRVEVIIYDSAGNEESHWNVVKDGFAVESCSLMRTIASTPRKPFWCP